MIYGVAGTFASGKDTLAEWLEHNGYTHVSTSDIVREGAKKEFDSTDRKYLFEYANKLRNEAGGGILVEQALAQTIGLDRVVISGIRSVGEAEALKEAGGQLVFVDAPVEIRHKRAFKRGRDAADVSLESFKKSEQKELSKPAENKVEQNIGAVRDMADIMLENDADLGTFFAEATALLKL